VGRESGGFLARCSADLVARPPRSRTLHQLKISPACQWPCRSRNRGHGTRASLGSHAAEAARRESHPRAQLVRLVSLRCRVDVTLLASEGCLLRVNASINQSDQGRARPCRHATMLAVHHPSAAGAVLICKPSRRIPSYHLARKTIGQRWQHETRYCVALGPPFLTLLIHSTMAGSNRISTVWMEIEFDGYGMQYSMGNRSALEFPKVNAERYESIVCRRLVFQQNRS